MRYYISLTLFAVGLSLYCWGMVNNKVMAVFGGSFMLGIWHRLIYREDR